MRSRAALTIASAAALLVAPAFLPGSAAHASPSADQWHQLRMCESTNNYSINTGNGYYGAYQFNLTTWQSVGGTGYPHQASPAEQDARALALYHERGWQPWTCATKLGFVDGSDASSGDVADITNGGGADQPSFPGQISYGQYSEALKTWQAQMAARGANIPATGYFGDITKSLALQLQVQNGFEQVGWIGPLTWQAAWTGAFAA
jgi:resuscitation-promoting factor RpfA